MIGVVAVAGRLGAEAAARRLQQLPAYKAANAIKVNPDAPQLPVRAMILQDGKTLYMPSPRLRGGFLRITPDAVPPGEERLAMAAWTGVARGLMNLDEFVNRE